MSELKHTGFITLMEPFNTMTPKMSCYKKDSEDFVLKEEVKEYFNISETKLISLAHTHNILVEQEFYITADSFFNLYRIHRKYRQEDRRCGQCAFPSLKYIKKKMKE